MSLLRKLLIDNTPKDYIKFADPVVEKICAENWGDGTGITYAQAARVTTLGNKFKGNTEIISFDELQYFENILELTEQDFAKCTSLSKLTLPLNCYALGTLASPYWGNTTFFNCKSLSQINLENIIYLGSGCFCNNTNLSFDINLPNLKGKIGVATFYKTAIQKVTNLGSCTKIDGKELYYNNNGAFEECRALRFVRIPQTVTEFGKRIFYNCISLETLIIENPNVISIDKTVLYNSNPSIYVPNDSVDLYKSADVWKTYSDKIHPMSEYQE